MICKIGRPFVNTFTAHDKYSILDKQYLLHPIHMQLTQKQKMFSQFFSSFLKSKLNFEHIKKNMTLIANGLPKVPSSKNRAR